MTRPPGTDVELLSQSAHCAVVGTSRGGVRELIPLGTASDTPFRIASLTKPVTAVATVLALAKANLTVDTPAIDLLPDLRKSWKGDGHISVADVLSQTSGLSPTVTGADAAQLGDSDTVTTDAARLVVAAGNDRPPGSQWEYYNGNYFLAGAIIAALAGTTYENALNDLVLRPWGLSDTSFDVPPDLAPGMEKGRPIVETPYPRGRRPSGGLCSTTGDLLTFGERLLGEGELLAQLQMVRTRPEDVMRYGLGWAVGPSGQMYLNGRLPGYRAALLLVPDHDLVGVSLGADTDSLPAQANVLSGLQLHLTSDDLAEAIDSFAA